MTTPETIHTLRCAIRERLLTVRCLERLVASDEFTIAYTKADELCRSEVHQFIDTIDIAAIKKWIHKQNIVVANYGALSLRELRVIAQKLGVPFYSRLPKASLLSEIAKYGKN